MLFPGKYQRLSLPAIRNTVQVSFALFLLYLGWRFWLFVRYFETSGATPLVSRPAGVEGFLPISALMAFRYWVTTGVFDPIHPAGLAIFLAIVLTAFLYKKAFCSWLCPIGTLSEGLARLGERLLGGQLSLPRWLDLPLMGLKYLVLGSFIKVIYWDMPVTAVGAFLNSPYNMVADVKMLRFFLDLSPTAVVVLLLLVLLSFLVRHFWCRYLCPYGAMLGLVSLVSPFKVTRQEAFCTGCGRCDRVCPGNIRVSAARRVSSVECSACLNCLHHCPRQGALALQEPFARLALPPLVFPLLFTGTFFFLLAVARLTGNWATVLSPADYMYLIPRAAFFGH